MRYKITMTLSDGDRIEVAVTARSKKEAIARFINRPEYRDFAKNKPVVDFEIMKIDDRQIDNTRFDVSVRRSGKYMVTDKMSGAQIEWSKGRYNDTNSVVDNGSLALFNPLESATVMREIGEFLYNHFKELVTNELEDIRPRIARAIKHSGMTQRELADAVGSSPQEINAFLRGRQVISFAKLDRIFKTLGL